MPNRLYRTFEGAIITLFFLQAFRLSLGTIIAAVDSGLRSGELQEASLSLLLLLAAILIPVWLAPRKANRITTGLLLVALLLAVTRILMTFPVQPLRAYSALIILGLFAVYCMMLLRISWITWVLSIGIGLIFEQLARAILTYDYTFNIFSRIVEISLSETELLPLRQSSLTTQIVLSTVLASVAWIAYRNANSEPYEPSSLSLVSGFGLGGFLSLQLMVLALPNVIGRWTQVPRAGLVFWCLLVIILGLLPVVQRTVNLLLAPFAPRLRGLIWLLVLLLLIVVGNLLNGPFSAASLIVAQLLVVLLLWFIPRPLSADDTDENLLVPAFLVAFLLTLVLLFVYHLSFDLGVLLFGQQLNPLLVLALAVIAASLPRLVYTAPRLTENRVALAGGSIFPLLIPFAVAGLIAAGSTGISTPPPAPDSIRIATLNMDFGRGLPSESSPTIIAQALEASRADIIVLQEVDTGSLLTYGGDQVEFLANRLGMYSAFRPTVGQLYGVAILSRWPMFELEVASLPGDATGQAVAIKVIVQDQATGRTVQVVGGQMVAGLEEQRVQQYAGLVPLIVDEPRDLPAVLAIDFGTGQDLIYDQIVLGAGYTDPYEDLGVDPVPTFPSEQPEERRDVIFSFGFENLAAREIEMTATDHNLVVVELGWPR